MKTGRFVVEAQAEQRQQERVAAVVGQEPVSAVAVAAADGKQI